MTNDQTFAALDKRARQAATAVKQVVADEAVPAFDPERVPGSGAPVVRPLPVDSSANGGRHRRRWIPLVSIAAALLVLVAVALGFLSGAGSEDSGTADDVRMANPEGLAATYLPDGLELSGVAVGSGTGTPAAAMTATFGPDAEGTALAAIGVPTEHLDLSDDQRVDAGERQAWVVEVDGRDEVYVRTGKDRYVILTSQTLDRDELVEAARHLKPDVGGAPDIGEAGLPSGWQRLTTLPTNALYGAVLSGGRDGVAVAYEDEPTSRAVVVLTDRGTDADLYAPQVRLTGVRPITVRGHEGIIGALPGEEPSGEGSFVLSWFEEPGRLVRVTGAGVSEAELVKVAEGLEPLEGSRLDELVDRSDAGELDAENRGTTPVAEGSTTEGASWTVRASTTGTGTNRDLSIEVTDENGDSESTTGSGGTTASGSEAVFGTVGDHRISSTRVVYGLAGADVATVQATIGSARRSIDITDLGDTVGYAFEVPIDAEVRLEALAADGSVLGEATATGDDVSTTGGATSTTIPAETPGG